MSREGARTDIVVPVHGGLHHVRHCLTALATYTSDARVIVVDDASSPYEARRLDELVAGLDAEIEFELLRNAENLGYLKSVNRGIRHGRGTRVVTLNSDVIVTPGWLAGLHAALDADPRNAIASPLSNHANLTRVEFPWGATFLEVADAVRALSPRRYPEIGIASGFCLIVRRHHLEDLGLFDEAYDPGYFEESDLCMRAMERGLRVVADDSTFVFHHGWASFGPEQRTALMRRNARIFERRWGRDAHADWQKRVHEERPFADLEAAVAEAIGGSPATPGAGPRWTIERERRRSAGPLPHPRLDPLPADTGEIEVRRRRPQGSALLLLPAIDTDAASTSLLRLASELVLRGRDVHVATSGPVNLAAFADPVVLRPDVFRDADEMLEELPAHDLVVATSVDTLLPALALRARDGCQVASLLGERAGRPLPVGPDVDAWAAGEALPRITHHLVRGVASPPSSVARGTRHQVPYGVDLDVFHPTSQVPATPHVVVPVSSHTRLAEWQTLSEALEIVMERMPGVAVTLYGMARIAAPAGARIRGHLTLGEEAALLREASIVVDPSGSSPAIRPRLRAFAVGVPLAVPMGPDPSGAALPGHNCLAFTPGDHDELARTMMDVMKDPLRHSGIAAAGLATAHAFDLERELSSAQRSLGRILGAEADVSDPDSSHPTWHPAGPAQAEVERFEAAKRIAMSRHDVTEDLQVAQVALEAAQRKLEEVYTSETWRVGHAILSFPKFLRRLFTDPSPPGA
jgi:GT2 family glycosyltransferase